MLVWKAAAPSAAAAVMLALHCLVNTCHDAVQWQQLGRSGFSWGWLASIVPSKQSAEWSACAAAAHLTFCTTWLDRILLFGAYWGGGGGSGAVPSTKEERSALVGHSSVNPVFCYLFLEIRQCLCLQQCIL